MAQVVWVSQTTSPEKDRICDRALDQFGTGAILHSFPKKTFPSRSEIAAPLGSPRRSRGRRFRTEVNDGASGLGFPATSRDRMEKSAHTLDEVGTGAMIHAFPRLHKPCS